MFRILHSEDSYENVCVILFLLTPVSCCCLPSFFHSISVSLVFCFLSSVIYFATSLRPFLCPPSPSPSLSLSLSLSPVDLAPVSFPHIHLSACCLFLGRLISFPISLSYMLGLAPCMRVNKGTALVNTQEDRQIQDGHV